jgi:chromosome segregation ATPase
MKELENFQNWADNIISTTLFEKTENKQGERAIERSHDIAYLAKQKYPDYSETQAIELYLSDKLSDLDARDYEQNKIINAQRKENEKLKLGLNSLRKEMSTIEKSGEHADQEISRLQALSGKIQTDIEKRRLSSDELNKALAQVDDLKNKSGIDRDDYEKIKNKVETFSKEKINPEEFSKLSDQLTQLSSKKFVDSEQIENLKTALDAVIEKNLSPGNMSSIIDKLNKLEAQQQEMSDISDRIKDLESIDLESARDIIQNLEQTKQDIETKQRELSTSKDNLDKFLQDERAELEKEKETAKQRMKDYLRRAKKRSMQASTKINALLGDKTTFDQIRDFGKNLNGVVSDIIEKPVEELDNYTAMNDINSEFRSLNSDVESTNADVMALRTAINDIQNRLSKSSSEYMPSKIDSNIYLNKDDDQEENDSEVDQNMTNKLKENITSIAEERFVLNKYRDNVDAYEMALERWCLISREFCAIYEELKQLFDDKNVQILVYNWLKNSKVTKDRLEDKSVEAQEFRKKLDNYVLPKLTSFLKSMIQTRKTRLGINDETNVIDRNIRELEESIDRIIGKKIANWIKL